MSKTKVVIFEDAKVPRVLTNPDLTLLANNPRAIINPDLSRLDGCPPHTWKLENGRITSTHPTNGPVTTDALCISAAHQSLPDDSLAQKYGKRMSVLKRQLNVVRDSQENSNRILGVWVKIWIVLHVAQAFLSICLSGKSHV